MSFGITYQNGKLQLMRQELDESAALYLQSYLDRVNSYNPIGFYGGSPVYSLYQPPLATSCGVRSLEMRLNRRFEKKRLPATATIAINKACQCDCLHCSAVYYNHSLKKDLVFDELKKAFLETVSLGVTTLILLGGEPLLRKDLVSLVDLVPKNLSSVILFTNGEFLTYEKCVQLKEAGLMGAFVSFDSYLASEHDEARRRPGLFDKALRSLGHLKKSGLIAGISSYLTSQRLREGYFEKMMELAKRSKVDEVTFFDAIPSGRWIRSHEVLLQPQDRKDIKELVKEFRNKTGYPGLSVQSTMTSEGGSAHCFAANTQFYLTASGEMCPCDFTPLTVGRFPDFSIQKLWEKMIELPPYHCRAKACRMQDPSFRKKYIFPIPENGPYPYPLSSVS